MIRYVMVYNFNSEVSILDIPEDSEGDIEESQHDIDEMGEGVGPGGLLLHHTPHGKTRRR